jgi:dUTP pyrophosphatase|tara:strand:- start:16964 stop:17482 length:519 start_codon:yes stop_codon:yes gene_type:complete
LKKEGKNYSKQKKVAIQFCIFIRHKTKSMIQVQVQNESTYELPSYATAASAGVDLKAVLEAPFVLNSLERKVIGTGLKIALPEGYEAQVRPRSGLAAKHGISVLNAPGTIDADYRGEIGVILVNLSNHPFTIEPGERIAQLVLARYEQIEWKPTSSLSKTPRGSGGFGSTGK